LPILREFDRKFGACALNPARRITVEMTARREKMNGESSFREKAAAQICAGIVAVDDLNMSWEQLAVESVLLADMLTVALKDLPEAKRAANKAYLRIHSRSVTKGPVPYPEAESGELTQ
jgi:hypothetical protein